MHVVPEAELTYFAAHGEKRRTEDCLITLPVWRTALSEHVMAIASAWGIEYSIQSVLETLKFD